MANSKMYRSSTDPEGMSEYHCKNSVPDLPQTEVGTISAGAHLRFSAIYLHTRCNSENS